jgi:hypothetical protein
MSMDIYSELVHIVKSSTLKFSLHMASRYSTQYNAVGKFALYRLNAYGLSGGAWMVLLEPFICT